MRKLFFEEKVFKSLDQWVGGLGLEKFVRIPRDGADKVARKAVSWHLAPFFIDDFEVEGVHCLLKPVEHLGMNFTQLF